MKLIMNEGVEVPMCTSIIQRRERQRASVGSVKGLASRASKGYLSSATQYAQEGRQAEESRKRGQRCLAPTPPLHLRTRTGQGAARGTNADATGSVYALWIFTTGCCSHYQANEFSLPMAVLTTGDTDPALKWRETNGDGIGSMHWFLSLPGQ